MASKKNKLEQAAAEATKGFFSVNDAVEAQNGTESASKAKAVNNTNKETEAVKMASTASQGDSVIFSVRADSERVAEWRAYAKAKKGASLSVIVADAMREYIKRHALTEAEAEIYNREMHKHEVLKGL